MEEKELNVQNQDVNNNEANNEEEDCIVITLEDDTQLECNILDIFPVEDKEYIALLPKGDDTVIFYEFHEDEKEGIDLKNIDDDNEYEKVADAFFDDEDEEEEAGEEIDK